MSAKRCWTCKDRKIRCDLGFPRCLNCKKSKRICPGYGLRLSWPRANDPKRFVIGEAPTKTSRIRRLSKLYLVNASVLDIEIFYHLSMPEQFTKPRILTYLPWSPSKLRGEEMDLLEYFESVVSLTLTTFSDLPLGGLLISIALSSNDPSNVAVLQSLLALSSLYRYGYQMQAAKLKVATLQSLRASTISTGKDIIIVEAVKHVAAGMLLCSFEIRQQQDALSHWVWYVSGAKDIVKALSIIRFHDHPMGKILLEWVYYHEVLARFGLRHWRRYKGHGYPVQQPPVCEFGPITCPGVPNLVHKFLAHFARVCETVLPPSDPMSKTIEYRHRLKTLELDIENTPVTMLAEPADPEKMTAHAIMVLELYQIGSIIYLNRASGDVFGQREKVEQLIDRGFSIFPKLEYCERTFPLLILGIEAQSDERRLAVLSLMSRSEKAPTKQNLHCLRELLQAMWVQNDLHTEGDKHIEYMERMSTVVSASEALPHFS